MKKKEFWLVIFCFCTAVLTMSSQSGNWENRLEKWADYNQTGASEKVIQEAGKLLKTIELSKEHLSDLQTVMGTAYRLLGQNEVAIEHHQKALKIREELQMEEKISNSLLNLGNCYLIAQKLDFAEDFYLKSQTLKEKILPSNSEKLVGIYNSLGNFYRIKNDLAAAKIYLDKVLKLAQKNELNAPSVLVDAHNSLGNFWYDQQFPDSAIFHFQKALQFQENYHLATSKRALIFNNLGNTLALKGFHNEANQILDSALTSCDTKMKGEVLYNKGNNFLDEGNFQEALQYYSNALHFSEHNAILQAQIYNSIGLAQRYFGNISEAKESFEEAINILYPLENEQFVFSNLADAFANFGQCYFLENAFSPSKYYLEKALNLYISNRENPTKIAYLLMKLSAVNLGTENYFAARANLEQAENLLLPNEKLPQFSLKRYWGNFYEKQDSLVVSEQFYRRAWLFLTETQNADNNSIFPFEEVEILTALSRVKSKIGGKENLEEAHILSQKAIGILNDLKGRFSNTKSEVDLQNAFYDVYNLAIEICLKLAKSQPIFKYKAFEIAEDYRGNLLKKLVQKVRVNSLISLPENLVEKENTLQNALTFYEKRKFEITQNEFAKTAQIQTLDSIILVLTNQKNRLKKEIEQKHPNYYQLLYDFENVNVFDLQKSLTDDRSLLMFQWGENSVWSFLINADTFLIQTIPNASGLRLAIAEMSSLYQVKAHLLPKEQKDFLFEKFVALSSQLYEKLIAPIENHLHEKITILPDGPLFYLPFELLIREAAKENRFLRGHDYLLKHKAIHYHYSANLLLNNNKIRDAAKNILVIAPKFEDSTLVLKNNEREADLIHQLLGGDIWKNGEDSKKSFISLVEDYRIFHLSTHGFMNDENPEYSYLIFSEKGEIEPFFVSEIYNLPMQNTEMVVLSACQTASGKLYRGEGILSLAHGFSFAGTKSLVASLWNVDDRQTPDLMSRFYNNLKQGLTKSEALRKAKLDYLKTASQDEAYPFYWAGFMIFGEDAPIEDALSEGNFFGSIILGAGFLILIFILFRKRKSQHQSQA